MEIDGTPLEEVPAPADSAGAITALLNQELGASLYSEAAILAAIEDPTATVISISRAGRLLAAAIARLLVPGDAGYYRRFGPVAEALFSAHTVGSLEAMAVLPSARRHGLGSRLVLKRLAFLAGAGCDRAVAVSWLSGRPGVSAPLYRRLGFREGPVVGEFYLDESRRDGWACPVCGSPCRCAAQLFWFEQAPAGDGSARRTMLGSVAGQTSESKEAVYEVDPEKRSDQAPGEEAVQVNDPYRGGGPAPDEQHGKEDEQHPTGG